MSIESSRARRAVGAGTLALGLCTLSTAAQAAFPTVWELRGTLTEVAPGVYPEDFLPGAPFRVLLAFDTEATISFVRNSSNDPVTSEPRPGKRYEYSGPAGLRMAIYIGESCNPCTVEPGVDFDAAAGLIFVRDDFQDARRNPTGDPYDGITWGMTKLDGTTINVIFRDRFDAFSPQIVAVDPAAPKPLPLEPDPRLPQMAESVFQVCAEPGACMNADIDSVSVPSYGTSYFLSAVHCGYPDLFEGGSFYGDDCFRSGGSQPRLLDVGGMAGQGDFVRPLFTPSLPPPGSTVAEPLGSVFGAVAFGGVGALPVLRASSAPSDVSRTNSNLLAYQEYTYGGSEPTDLALVANLSYSIHSHDYAGAPPVRPSGAVIAEGVRPGSAVMSTVLAIVDASRVPAASMAALPEFGSLQCGAEELQRNGAYVHRLPDGGPWPAGSILGAAVYSSPEAETADNKSVVLRIFRCEGNAAVAGEPVRVAPGARFYLAASTQTPARGRNWYNSTSAAPAGIQNGFVDAANTIRVIPDPAAPPEVQQQLAAGLAPACEDCAFEPEVRIDVKPDSTDNVVSVASQGVIPVALLGSDRFQVHDVDVESLRLGELSLRRKGRGSAQCAAGDVNGDGLPDLLCHFENATANWQQGQTVATLTGAFKNGELIFASDTIRLVP